MIETPYMHRNSRIFVAGHQGLLGSAICRSLVALGYSNIATQTRQQLDLRNTAATARFFASEQPEFVFLAAARVGGILANQSSPADFLIDNLSIQNSVLQASRTVGVKRLLFLASSAIYPRDAPQPITEASLLTGPLEPTNRAYAVAKIAGIEMCWAMNRQYGTRYLTAIPSNLYGAGDKLDLKTSHVLPALIRKALEAKQASAEEIEVWGSGTPLREFLYADDLAEACVFLMNLEELRFDALLNGDHPPAINVGTGDEVTIRQLAETVARVVGFNGTLRFDPTKPDGTPRKVMDSSRIRQLGWRPGVSLEAGIKRVSQTFAGAPKNPD